MRRVLAMLVVGIAGLLGRTAGAQPVDGPPARFALVVHVAAADPTDTEARVGRLLDTANRHFAAAGVAFGVAEQRELPASYAVVETIRERRQLRRLLVPRAINVFLVDAILDPVPSDATRRAARWQGREPSGRLSGAHIEAPGKQPGTYILLARTRRPTSLAHELGHFFGVAHHKDPTNIMSYGAERDHFAERQLEVFDRRARRFRRQRILRLL